MVHYVNFENKTASYFTTKHGFIGNTRELQLGTSKVWQSQKLLERIQERRLLTEEEEGFGAWGTVLSKSPLEETGNPTCCGCSVAESSQSLIGRAVALPSSWRVRN